MHSNVVVIALSIWTVAALAIGSEPAPAQSETVMEVTARGSFDDVKQQLVLAIENRGLIVNHESKVGEMLERTGKDLGVGNRIYVRAEVLEFCSAALSRQVMEADARLLALCPYGLESTRCRGTRTECTSCTAGRHRREAGLLRRSCNRLTASCAGSCRRPVNSAAIGSAVRLRGHPQVGLERFVALRELLFDDLGVLQRRHDHHVLSK